MRPLLAIVAGVLLALCLAGVAESRDVGDAVPFRLMGTNDCPPGGCPGGECPTQPQPPQWRPGQQTPRSPYGIQWKANGVNAPAPRQAMPGFVCRVENQNAQSRRGLISECGTGALIYKDARLGGVLTCKHILVGGVGELVVIFPSVNQRYKARLTAVDPKQDLSYWTIKSPPMAPCPMASDYASSGDAITLLGLGQGSFRAQRGRVSGYQKTTTGNVFNLTGGSRQGDSGGPVLNERGELTGVLWGTSGRTTSATFIGDIHAFLCKDRYAFPWNADLAAKKAALAAEAARPDFSEMRLPGERPPLPQQPPVDLSGVNARIADLEADVRANEDRLAPLEVTADKARQLVEQWAPLQAEMKKLEASAMDARHGAASAAVDAKMAMESVTEVAGLAGEAVSIAGDANATVKAALDEDAPDGLVARIRAKVHDKLESTLTAKLAAKVGLPTGPMFGIVGVALALGFWFLKREVDRAQGGQQTLAQRLADKTDTPLDNRAADGLAAAMKSLGDKLEGKKGK